MDDSEQAHALTMPGTALRDIRTRRGLKLSDVGELTGIPVSTLSKIETGKSELTMDRLVKISLALGVNIADLFRTTTAAATTRARRSIIRIGEGEIVSSPSGRFNHHAQDLLDKRVMPIVAEITARTLAEFGDYHRHDGEEYVYVLTGELGLYTDTYAPVRLGTGEAIYFDSGMGHAYLAVGEAPCRILIVYAPTGSPFLFEGSAAAAELPAPARRLEKDGLHER